MGAHLLLVVAAALIAPTAGEPTVDEIVARHVAARGGRQALASVRTVRMAGRATEGPGRAAIVRREIARPGRIRTELEAQGTTSVSAWDGSTGWRVSPLAGRFEAEPLPAEEAAAVAEEADIDGPLVDWKAKGHAVEVVGSETLSGRAAHRLKVTLRSGAARHVWLDAATGLVVRTQSVRRWRGREVTLETLWDNYQETGGVAFPRSIEIGVPGRPRRLRIVVEQLETNVPLDDARFRMVR